MEENKNINQVFDKKITRKQAIQKAGITALTAASLVFLETKKASADSQSPTDPGRGVNASAPGASTTEIQNISVPENASTDRGLSKNR